MSYHERYYSTQLGINTVSCFGKLYSIQINNINIIPHSGLYGIHPALQILQAYAKINIGELAWQSITQQNITDTTLD
jgi:hypothetical protein